MKAQIIAKMTLIPMRDQELRISNQLRNLSRSEQAEKYHGVKIANFEGCFD